MTSFYWKIDPSIRQGNEFTKLLQVNSCHFIFLSTFCPISKLIFQPATWITNTWTDGHLHNTFHTSLVVTSSFSLSHSVFYTTIINKLPFYELHLLCCLQILSVWTSLKVCHYTPAKGMFSGVYWNHSVCPSMCPSVYKILVSVKVLAWVLNLSQTTNLRLFQTERVCRRQFQILMKIAESSSNR